MYIGTYVYMYVCVYDYDVIWVEAKSLHTHSITFIHTYIIRCNKQKLTVNRIITGFCS